MVELADVVEVLARDPSASALLFDFDGTLAPIVDRPHAARPAPRVPELLRRLATRVGVVGVISGRSRSFLEAVFDPSIAIAGLYGLEVRADGRSQGHPEAARWQAVVADVTARASAHRGWIADGVVVESKGVSLTIHHRNAPHRSAEIDRWAAEVAHESGLEVRAAKASVELHPDVGIDKGTALRTLVADADPVFFAGDDLGDLPAFAVLAELRAGGRRTVGMAVGTDELPVEVAAAADLVVPGPSDVVELLDRLVAALGVGDPASG